MGILTAPNFKPIEDILDALVKPIKTGYKLKEQIMLALIISKLTTEQQVEYLVWKMIKSAIGKVKFQIF